MRKAPWRMPSFSSRASPSEYGEPLSKKKKLLARPVGASNSSFLEAQRKRSSPTTLLRKGVDRDVQSSGPLDRPRPCWLKPGESRSSRRPEHALEANANKLHLRAK
jgi:hypothetical protein